VPPRTIQKRQADGLGVVMARRIGRHSKGRQCGWR
jgi:hypothetical protein